jgi:quinol-cytochrome oxidoreductase complex cytochrome b subunit
MSEINDKKNHGTIPFYPDHLRTEIRVVWILIGIAVVIGIIAAFNPVGLEEPADPMVTPDHVKSEWYFLALYQMLKFVPKTMGVMLPILGLLFIFIWPFFAKKEDSKKQMRQRTVGSAIFMVIVIAMTIWGWYS